MNYQQVQSWVGDGTLNTFEFRWEMSNEKNDANQNEKPALYQKYVVIASLIVIINGAHVKIMD